MLPLAAAGAGSAPSIFFLAMVSLSGKPTDGGPWALPAWCSILLRPQLLERFDKRLGLGPLEPGNDRLQPRQRRLRQVRDEFEVPVRPDVRLADRLLIAGEQGIGGPGVAERDHRLDDLGDRVLVPGLLELV